MCAGQNSGLWTRTWISPETRCSAHAKASRAMAASTSLAAGVVGLDAVQEHGGELGEELAPLRLETAGGVVDHAIEVPGGRGHGAPIVLERRAAARRPANRSRAGPLRYMDGCR